MSLNSVDLRAEVLIDSQEQLSVLEEPLLTAAKDCKDIKPKEDPSTQKYVVIGDKKDPNYKYALYESTTASGVLKFSGSKFPTTSEKLSKASEFDEKSANGKRSPCDIAINNLCNESPILCQLEPGRGNKCTIDAHKFEKAIPVKKSGNAFVEIKDGDPDEKTDFFVRCGPPDPLHNYCKCN
jgi:hypothetical protein